MNTHTAREKSVAVGDVDVVRGRCARSGKSSCHALRPAVYIASRVADNSLLSGRSGRGVNSDKLISRHGKKSERIVISEILLYCKGQLADIVYRVDIFRLESYFVKLCLIKRDIFIASFYGFYQSCALYCVQIIARRCLNFRAEILCHRIISPFADRLPLMRFSSFFRAHSRGGTPQGSYRGTFRAQCSL